MYKKYFGLNSKPFSMTPDPKMLFLTAAHRESLAGLNYAIVERKGFVVLIGEAGTGKTTLLRKMLEMLPLSEVRASVVLNPTLSAAEFLELLLLNFGVLEVPQSKAQRLRVLEQVLTESDRAGLAPLLVVDEAHKLNFEVLEEIRLLTNFETSEHKLLQIVLIGQPELNDLLNLPELRQLKQRVAIRLRVGPLRPDEVDDYICLRWHHASGVFTAPFTTEAIKLIAERSLCIPRLINSICDNALLLAFSETAPIVGNEIILRVVHDLDLRADPTPESGPGTGTVRAIAMAAKPGPNSPRPELKFSPETGASEPFQFGTLERYMPARQGKFLRFRWTRTKSQPAV